MTRVLFVDHARRILGGAEVNLVELLATEAACQAWQMACACAPGSPLSEHLRSLPVQLHPFELAAAGNELRIVGRRLAPLALLQGWRTLAHARSRLREILLTFQPDVLISCTNKDHLCVGPLARQLGLPSLWWVNDIVSPDFFSWPVRWIFCRQARRCARQLVAVSDFSRQALLRQSLPPSLVTTVQNGIPLGKYRRTPPGALRARLQVLPDEPLIALIGRFTPWKGQELFLQLARAWISRSPTGHFVLIGQAFNEEQSFETALRRYVATHRLNERVHFVPFQDAVAPLLSDVDCLVHASTKPEPFGRVILEAMAVGVPVIAARHGGVPEIISDGVDGLLVTPGDLGAYLRALPTVLHSPETARRLVQAARQTVSARFTDERVQAQFAQLIASATPVGRVPSRGGARHRQL